MTMQPERPHPFDLPIQRILVDLETRLPPWMKLVTPSTQESPYTRLSNEITAFGDLVSPTLKEKQVRQGIIERLEGEVKRIWRDGRVVPIGSYAQDLYTSSSDMDLFVELIGVSDGFLNEHLEILYQHLEMSTLAERGTLTIVRGARVPIIKYIDSHGSGIQVDVSMNNISATSSTTFVTHHLTHQPLLRPLTMVLKQWLFQRKMNEVYSRGGLSSYALFLLVLTTVHYYPLVASYPPDELLGRYLVEFLRYWSSPDAVMDVIRPLKSPLQKGWPELYQPYGLCILDPVNEENWIGGATFSIREIQEEWGLSFTALSVAIEEFMGNINGGREKSLLASIVGLTTREYESRKQINSCQIRSSQPAIPRPSNTVVATMNADTRSGTKLTYPVQEFYPTPTKRTKFRNMLTKDGGLVGDEVVERIIAKTGNRRDIEFGELLDPTAHPEEKKADVLRDLENGANSCMVDLLNLDPSVEFSMTTKEINPEPEFLEFSHPSPTLTTPSIATTPSTPSLQSGSTNLTTFSTPTKYTSAREQLLISESPPKSTSQSLLNLQDESKELEGSSFRDLASLSGSFESGAVNELSGLDFGDLNLSSSSVLRPPDLNGSSDIYSQIHEFFSLEAHTLHSPQVASRQTELVDLTFPAATKTLSNTFKPHNPSDSSRILDSTKEEAIVFQGRRSRRSSPDIDATKAIDPTSAERAFRMFSAGIRKA